MNAANDKSDLPPPIIGPLDQAKNGDVAAFKALCSPHLTPIYSLCYGICDETEITEELTAAIVVQAWETLSEVDTESDLEAFLHQNAEKLLWTQIRRKYIPGKKPSTFPRSILQQRIADLASSQDYTKPQRSLWPDILGEIETENISPNDRIKQARKKRKRHYILLAIACIIVLIFFIPGDDPVPEPESPTPTAESPVTQTPLEQAAEAQTFELPEHIKTLQQEYGIAKNEVIDTFVLDEDSDESMAQQSMVEDLGVVETAITEIISALRAEPENEMLEEMLVTTYVKQMKLLTSAVRLFD